MRSNATPSTTSATTSTRLPCAARSFMRPLPVAARGPRLEPRLAAAHDPPHPAGAEGAVRRRNDREPPASWYHAASTARFAVYERRRRWLRCFAAQLNAKRPTFIHLQD